MRAFAATVSHEIRAVSRERLPQLILGIFVFMVALSGLIGWMTHTTVISVYDEALREGLTQQPNPFLNLAALDPVKNTVIYIALIGALFAILLGVESALRDRRAKVLELIFSRPISPRNHALAKFLGACLWLGGILLVAAAVTWTVLWPIGGKPLLLADCLPLLAFFAISWVFLVPFVATGIIFGKVFSHESSALLVPILIWVALTFVIPQLGTAEEPIGFLNPIPSQVASQAGFFQTSHSLLLPLSFVDHYKELSAVVLGVNSTDQAVVGQALEFLIVVLLPVFVLIALAPRLRGSRELYE